MRRRLLTVGATLLVLCVAVVTARAVLRASRARLNLRPEQCTLLDRFLDTPIELPRDWQTPPVVSDDMALAANSMLTEWNARGSWLTTEWCSMRDAGLDHKLLAPHSLTTTGTAWLQRVSDDMSTFTRSLLSLVRDPNYEMCVFHSPKVSFENFLFLGMGSKLLAMEASLAFRRGDTREAFDLCLAGVGISKRHPASPVVYHHLSFLAQPALLMLAHQAGESTDTRQLGRVLAALDSLDVHVNADARYLTPLAMTLASLQIAKLRDERIDLTGRHPLSHFLRLQSREQNGLYERFKANYEFLTRVAAHSPGLQGTMKAAANAAYYSAQPVDACLIWDALTRQRVLKALYDLARVSIAERIARLDGKPHRATVLTDPFTSMPYAVNTATGQHYSFGPDRSDNKAAIAYDPTNGLVSQGDVFLVAPKP